MLQQRMMNYVKRYCDTWTSRPLFFFFEVKVHISFSVCQRGYGKEGDRCVVCPVGSYGNFNSQLCEPCPSGTTNTVAASHGCGMYLA